MGSGIETRILIFKSLPSGVDTERAICGLPVPVYTGCVMTEERFDVCRRDLCLSLMQSNAFL